MAPALQISIPSTSTATPSSGKPYTVYHVTLQLPLRRHQVRKRYTDFVNLHESLISQTGAAPPAPLPAKSWLRRTVNNDALTEERRKGLEKYLRGILEAEDARWRSCSAWRAFLNLPSGSSTGERSNSGGVGGATHTRTHSGGDGGGIADPNLWLDVHRDLKTQIQTARQQLKQREAATTPQQQHALSAEAKASLVRAATSIAQLDDGLRRMASAGGSKPDDRGAGWTASKSIGDGEIRRRRDLLGAARKEVEGLEGVLKSMSSSSTTSLRAVNGSAASSGAAQPASSSDKEALWRGTSTSTAAHAKPSARVLGGPPLKETERTRELDNAGVLQLQQQVMQDQEEDVLSLGQTVARLKDMGIIINEELTIQNQMLGVLEEDTNRVQGKIDVARKRIGKIS